VGIGIRQELLREAQHKLIQSRKRHQGALEWQTVERLEQDLRISMAADADMLTGPALWPDAAAKRTMSVNGASMRIWPAMHA